MPDELVEVEVEAPDYSGGIEPEIIEEGSRPAEVQKPFEEIKTEPEKNSEDDISYEEYQEFLRWKKMMKKKDMEM